MPVIPYGVHSGLACLDIPYAELDPENPDSLAIWTYRARSPGQSIVRLDGPDVPWGSQELDKAILRFKSDPDVHAMDIWTMRSCQETLWASPDVWTVLDISELLTSAPAKELRRRLDSLPLMPRPMELVARAPAKSSITHSFLDEISGRLDPNYAWIYTTDPEPHDRACDIAQRTYSTWGVRYGD